MSVPRRKRDPGLPQYLLCPDCDGSGYVLVTPDAREKWCGYVTAAGSCPNPLCFDGSQICVVCARLGLKPRVENPGPDYLVPILATVVDGEEAVCAYHFTHCPKGHVYLRTEDGPICECDAAHPSHDEDRAERQYDRDLAAYYGASTPQTEAERYRAAAELKRRLG